ncbi:MAG TPA: hypothetical protein VGQ02_02600 [Candidatus Limnocylindrales bacterium]|nr:hypothetical protein [Candidatus Limnocylindrales bacterium]
MSPALVTALTLISGVSWTVVYLEIINRGFRDRTYGMPLFALAFNVGWEFIFGFLVGEGYSLQRIVNVVWFVFDVVIVVTYFRYGRLEYPATVQRWFIPWSVTAFVVAFAILYVAHFEFEDFWGARYSAFAQNLMMSILFIAMLVGRDDVRGQSMYVAIFKWLGTLAPTIQMYGQTGSNLILVLGIAVFLYDVIYIAMLYRKFGELGLNPFTRRPAVAAATGGPLA